MRRNCWEVIGCQRYPGGSNVNDRGPCPASTLIIATGINNGMNGGRACWAIAGTFCGGKNVSDLVETSGSCQRCDFLAQVMAEEGDNFMGTKEIREDLATYQLF